MGSLPAHIGKDIVDHQPRDALQQGCPFGPHAVKHRAQLLHQRIDVVEMRGDPAFQDAAGPLGEMLQPIAAGNLQRVHSQAQHIADNVFGKPEPMRDTRRHDKDHGFRAQVFDITQPDVNTGRAEHKDLRKPRVTMKSDCLIILAAAFANGSVMNGVLVTACQHISLQFITGGGPRHGRDLAIGSDQILAI